MQLDAVELLRSHLRWHLFGHRLHGGSLGWLVLAQRVKQAVGQAALWWPHRSPARVVEGDHNGVISKVAELAAAPSEHLPFRSLEELLFGDALPHGQLSEPDPDLRSVPGLGANEVGRIVLDLLCCAEGIGSPARAKIPAEAFQLAKLVPELLLGRALLDAVEPDYACMFALATETGARLAEVLGLVWENIDLDRATVTFTHQLDRDRRRAPLKTRRSRRVLEVTPQLVSALRRHKLASARSGPHDFLWVTRNGTPHDHRNIGGRVLSRAARRARLEAVEHDGVIVLPGPTFHAFRHSHASALIASGRDVVEVSARLGHSSVATTLRVYAHEFDAARRSDDRRNRLVVRYGQTAQPAAAPSA